MTDAVPSDPPPPPPTEPAAPTGPLAVVPLVLAVAGAVLLVGGVLFALASASASPAEDADRFRRLGQAANPFIAFLSLAAAAFVSEARRRRAASSFTAGGLAMGIATTVSVTLVLLALNGVFTDVTGDTTALFRFSAIVSRLATLALSVATLWIAFATEPARP